LEDKAIRGVPWTLLAYAGSKAINVVTTVVLARLLVPEDFGIIALANLTMNVVNVLKDFGLGGAFVLQQDLDERGKGTILTLLMAMGTGGALLLAAASPLVAEFFHEERLTAVLAFLSITVFFGGFASFYETALWRELEFRRRFVAFAAQSLSFAAIAIGLALLGAGLWSMVVGQTAAAVVLCAALYVLSPYHVRPAFDRESARRTLGISKGFLLQGGIAIVQTNVDYLAVGRVLGAVQAGFYSVAFRMSELPFYMVAEPVGKVTFPAFARMRERGESIQGSFLSALRLVALAACPLGVLLSATANPFVETIFGQKWLPMIGATVVMGLWGAVRPLQTTLAWLLNSVEEATVTGVVASVGLVFLVPGLFLAADLGGITGVAWAMLASAVVESIVLAGFVASRAKISLGDQLRSLRPVLVACAGTWVVARSVAEALDPQPAVALLAASAAGMAAYLALLALVEPGLLAKAVHQIGRTMGRGANREESDLPAERAPEEAGQPKGGW
jgi:lipopolysaccharide exporter